MGNIPYQEPKFFSNHKSFLKGRKHVEDEPRSRRPSTSKTEETCEGSCRSDRRLTIRMMSDQLNLNSFTVHQILTEDLHMRKVCAKMVPKNHLHHGIFDLKRHPCSSPAPLFT